MYKSYWIPAKFWLLNVVAFSRETLLEGVGEKPFLSGLLPDDAELLQIIGYGAKIFLSF